MQTLSDSGNNPSTNQPDGISQGSQAGGQQPTLESNDLTKAQSPSTIITPPLSEAKIQNNFEQREDDYLDHIEELEKDVQKLKKKTRKKLGCKTTSCLGCLIIIILLGLIVFFKPPFILNPFKSYLNGAYGNEVPAYEKRDVKLNDLFGSDSSKQATFELTETDLINLLACDKCSMKIDRIEIESQKITFLKNLSNSGYPLWFAIEIKIADDAFKVEKIGLGKLDLPELVTNSIAQKSFDVINETDNNTFFNQIVNKLLGPELGQLIKPKNINLSQDKMIITINPADLPEDNEIDIQSYIETLLPE